MNAIKVYVHKISKYNDSNIIEINREIGYPKDKYIDVATANIFINEYLYNKYMCNEYGLFRVLLNNKKDDVSVIFFKNVSSTETYLYTFSSIMKDVEVDEKEIEMNVIDFFDEIVQKV